MARPTQGGSINTWGGELNAWIDQNLMPFSGGGMTGRIYRDDLGSGAWGDTSSFISFRRDMANLTGTQNSPVNIQIRGRGTVSVSDRLNSIYAYTADSFNVPLTTPIAVSTCANNGSGLIRVTTTTSHGYVTSDRIAVYGVTGTTEANGAWTITRIDATNFDLQGSSFSHAYVSGGSVTNRPMMYGVTSVVDIRQSRGSLTGTAASADDVTCFTGFNGSSGASQATEGFYLGRNAAGFPSSYEWVGGFSCPAYVQSWGFGAGAGRIGNGGAFFDASRITYDATSYSFASQNGIWLRSLAQNQTNPTNMIRVVSGGSQVELGTPGSSTGNTHTVAAGSTTSVFTNTTFDGSNGATGYTIGDIVNHLKNHKILTA